MHENVLILLNKITGKIELVTAIHNFKVMAQLNWVFARMHLWKFKIIIEIDDLKGLSGYGAYSVL